MRTAIGLALLIASPASAATLTVGTGKQFNSLAQAALAVSAGDVIEIEGDATYGSVRFTRSGTPQAKITVRGVTARRGFCFSRW